MSKSKNTIKKVKPPKKGRFIGINLNTLSIAILAFIAISIFMNMFGGGDEANEVSLSLFIDNIKNDKYSTVEIRDNGTSVATGKFIDVVETESNDIPQNENVTVKTFNQGGIEEINLQQLTDVLTPPSFIEIIQNAAQGQGLDMIDGIYLGEEFVLLDNAQQSSPDYLYLAPQSFSFDEYLSQEGINPNDIRAEIVHLQSASRQVQNELFNSNIENTQYGNVWIINNSGLGRLNDEYVLRESLNWSGITDNFSQFLQDEGIEFDSGTTLFESTVVTIVPWGDIITIGILLAFGILGFMMFRGIQGSGSQLMKFGQSKARMIFGSKPDVTFKDVAGVDEAKEELREVVLFLKEPKRFLDRGARIPKGLLMVGPPGTGKTLLARAIAGEAGVPFFHTSGSEFEEMLVGAGASRVRDLFEKAKKSAPAIIFIDEIDAVARKRGTTIQSGTTEQTLNQILVEMDGFEKNVNVIVIAATNRPDVLDAAILRPGRFDRRIVLDLPDIEGRTSIIKIHAKNKPIAKSVDLETVAKRTVGFSGADLENMLNEAAIIVAKDDRDEITFNDIEEAANKVQIGPAKRRRRDEKELRMTAYHEAGHALVMKLSPEHDPVHRVTIISRGMALGYTMPLPQKDQVQMTKTKMLSNIRALVAGYATEKMVFGDVTSGAANDIEKATEMAKRMVKSFGMSEKLGLVKYGQEENLTYLGHSYGEDRDYSEATSEIIDQEVRKIIQDAYAHAQKLLDENRKILDEIVQELLKKEVLDAEEFNAFFEDDKSSKEEN